MAQMLCMYSTLVYRQSASPIFMLGYGRKRGGGGGGAACCGASMAASGGHGEQLVDKRCCEGASRLQISLDPLHW